MSEPAFKYFKNIKQSPTEQTEKKPIAAVDIEAVVLGSMMLENKRIVQVVNILKPESFYNDSHRKIYEAILKLWTHSEPVDMMTVIAQLRKNSELESVGGAYYISQLTGRLISATNIEYHSRLIAQAYIQREYGRVAAQVLDKSFDPSIDVEELIEETQRDFMGILNTTQKKEVQHIHPLLSKALKRIDEINRREDGLSGLPSGFTALDRVTSGWQPSDMIIVAGRPSMGKTAFVLSMMRNMAVEHRVPIAMFSLEMSADQLLNRLVMAETGMSSDKLKSTKLTETDWVEIHAKTSVFEKAPIYIDDTAAISLFELKSKCMQQKALHDIKMIIIDYLQLMTGPKETTVREQEVSMISRGLKAIAKELDIPVVVLSQLNRQVETRAGDKRPQLSDLRESGAIEQDADIVMFVHRPERFGLLEDENGNSTKGLAEIVIAKHRNGAVCNVQLRFVAELAKFTDWDAPTISAADWNNSTNWGSASDFEPTKKVGEGEPF